mgnify:CR=1 FL=1
MARKKSIIPGFSLNRALGITSAKQKIARATGIPTTKQGRKRKMQSHLWTAAAVGVASALSQPAQKTKSTAPTQSREYATVSPENMYDAAVSAVIDAGEASTTILQRNLRIGYSQAARLIDQMENDGIVGPFEGDKPREVLITREQWLDAPSNDVDCTGNQYYDYGNYDPEPPRRKPLYKRVWFWVLVVLLVSGLKTRIAKWQAESNKREEARVLAELAERDAQKQADATDASEPDTPAEEEQPSVAEDHYANDDPEQAQEEPEQVSETTEVSTEKAVPETASAVTEETEPETSGNVTTIVVPVTPSTETTSSSTEPVGQTYVLNTSTHKFHRESCSSVKKIDPENYSTYTGTRDGAIAMGYEACGRCHP